MGKEEAKETLGVPFHHVSTLGVLDTFQHTDERIHFLLITHLSCVLSLLWFMLSYCFPRHYHRQKLRAVPFRAWFVCTQFMPTLVAEENRSLLPVFLFIYLVCILKNEAMLWFNAGSGAEGNTYPTIWKREARRSFRHFDWWISLSLSSVLCYFRSLTHNLDPRCLLWLEAFLSSFFFNLSLSFCSLNGGGGPNRCCFYGSSPKKRKKQ